MKNKAKEQDFKLIYKINKGNMSAFRQLVYKYKDISLSLADSILKDSVIAEDVLQDVFVKVFNKLNTFNYKSSFATWLYRIVINTSYNELKKRKQNIPIHTIEETFNPSYEEKGLVNKADHKKYIGLALSKLRPDEALLLRLFYLCELHIKEIEDITGFKPSKIKVDLHRGRENMHFELKQLLGDDLKYLL